MQATKHKADCRYGTLPPGTILLTDIGCKLPVGSVMPSRLRGLQSFAPPSPPPPQIPTPQIPPLSPPSLLSVGPHPLSLEVLRRFPSSGTSFLTQNTSNVIASPCESCMFMQAVSPICIVHGPFGCGKSSLLVALVHYLLTQRSQAGSALKGCRVLLSAHTNIAVDRLMTGLMDTGCSGQLALTTTATHVMVARVCPADTYCIQNHCCTAAIFHIHNIWLSRVLPLKPIAESFAWRVEACSSWHLHGCFPLPSLCLGSCTSASCIGSHCREEAAVTSWTWL